MRISRLAERSGVPASTLRFYEGNGLLPADRTPAGYRLYGEEAVERLAFIGAAKHLGLPLAEIGELLAVWESGACAEVKADLRPRVAARLEEAKQRATDLAAFTASLRQVLEHLDALPDRTDRCGPACGFPALAAPATARPEEQTERWRSAPVACSLTGDGMTERTAAWREALSGADRTAIPDGVRLTLPADRIGRIAGLAHAEQHCCPFFDFRLHLVEGRFVDLEVRAPDEGAQLLDELFVRDD